MTSVVFFLATWLLTNICYLDLNSSLVKRSHHATFDEAWYLQLSQPPAAQLLYDLGLEAETVAVSETGTDMEPPLVPGFPPQSVPVPWPPSFNFSKTAPKWDVPFQPRMVPLPFWETALSHPIAVAAARVRVTPLDAASIVTAYGIGKDDMATDYMSLDPFFDAFEEDLDLRKWSFDKHHTAGLSLLHHNGHLYLGKMTPSSPGAKVDKWRLHLRGARLLKIGSSTVSTIAEADAMFKDLYDRGTPSVTLLFSHPEI